MSAVKACLLLIAQRGNKAKGIAFMPAQRAALALTRFLHQLYECPTSKRIGVRQHRIADYHIALTTLRRLAGEKVP